MGTSASAGHDSGHGGQGGHGGEGAGGSIFSGVAPAGAGKTTAALLGEIVWLMSQSPTHKQFFIADLEWLVMTPLLLQQFRIYYADKPMPAAAGQQAGESAPQPLGVLFWGFVDAEVEGRLKAGNAKLRPQDWRSGDRLWVIDVLAPFGAGDEMVKDLKLRLFRDRPLNLLAVESGRLTAKVV